MTAEEQALLQHESGKTKMVLRKLVRNRYAPDSVYSDDIQDIPLPPEVQGDIPRLALHPIHPTRLLDGAPTHPVPATSKDITLAANEDMAAILKEIVTGRDDPNDLNSVPVVTPRDHRLVAFDDMRDLHLDYLNEDQRAIVTAWFDQARPEAPYHDQVRDIGAAPRDLRPSVKFDDIGSADFVLWHRR
jgi:hypothetical protein